MEKKEEKLNSLLEDALDDLLDDEHVTDEQEQTQSTSKKPEKMEVPNEADMNDFFAKMEDQLKSGMPKVNPADQEQSVSQIFDLMQNLLSKQLLYPALKDLTPKFEEYLKTKGSTLSKQEKRRYRQQIEKINSIVAVFDDDSLNDREKFEKNLDLMEQMQSLGSPPDELTVPEGMGNCSVI